MLSMTAPCTSRRFGILDRCKELVEAGYDVRQLDKENVSLLHWAAINNRLELVKYEDVQSTFLGGMGGGYSVELACCL